MKRFPVIATMLILSAGIFSSCLEDVEEVPLGGPDALDAPTGLSLEVGDGSVALSWDTVTGAASYNIYRRPPASGSFFLAGNVTATGFTDYDVTNGLEYTYKVAGVTSTGVEGAASANLIAVPSVYSIMIAGGGEVTGTRVVVLSMTAPSSTVLIKISNNALLAGSAWETYSDSREWEIPAGDGLKTVYAMFQDQNGYQSGIVSSSIELDTYAGISSISILEGTGPFTIGQTVHFALQADGEETGGQAWLTLEGLADPIMLRDDGQGGDIQADNGIYQARFSFPAHYRGNELGIAGQFTDRAGNTAILESSQTISFTDPPQATALLDPMEVTSTSVTLKWVESTEPDFLAYRIYRSTDPGVTDLPQYFVRGLDNRAQTSYPDTGLDEAVTYHYRIYVVNDLEEVSTGSNELEVSTVDEIPTPVVLDPPSAIGTDRLTLTWSVNHDTDFEEYEIRYSTSPGVTITSPRINELFGERDVTWYDHTGLDLAGNTYYYRVFVYDRQGNVSRSNEVSTQ
ncbi:MAG TPA: hypothetical protein VLA34_02110 [Candidatus Krumholzibacterium sp.]|nr:hypothetical protein [Candidatus Krumholzibacterium sp.]